VRGPPSARLCVCECVGVCGCVCVCGGGGRAPGVVLGPGWVVSMSGVWELLLDTASLPGVEAGGGDVGGRLGTCPSPLA
jgi:hypothetical protein